MDKLSKLIPKVLNKRGLRDEAQASYVVFLAKEWLHETLPQFSDDITVPALRDGVLNLETAHPIVSQELTQHVETLLSHLNSFEGISVAEVRIQRKK